MWTVIAVFIFIASRPFFTVALGKMITAAVRLTVRKIILLAGAFVDSLLERGHFPN